MPARRPPPSPATAALSPAYPVGVPYEPTWAEMQRLSTEASVSAAMDLYYKRDRLNRPGGTRERLIADREQGLAAKGYDCLASHHDAVTGTGIWMRFEDGGVAIYAS